MCAGERRLQDRGIDLGLVPDLLAALKQYQAQLRRREAVLTKQVDALKEERAPQETAELEVRARPCVCACSLPHALAPAAQAFYSRPLPELVQSLESHLEAVKRDEEVVTYVETQLECTPWTLTSNFLECFIEARCRRSRRCRCRRSCPRRRAGQGAAGVDRNR